MTPDALHSFGYRQSHVKDFRACVAGAHAGLDVASLRSGFLATSPVESRVLPASRMIFSSGDHNVIPPGLLGQHWMGGVRWRVRMMPWTSTGHRARRRPKDLRIGTHYVDDGWHSASYGMPPRLRKRHQKPAPEFALAPIHSPVVGSTPLRVNVAVECQLGMPNAGRPRKMIIHRAVVSDLLRGKARFK